MDRIGPYVKIDSVKRRATDEAQGSVCMVRIEARIPVLVKDHGEAEVLRAARAAAAYLASTTGAKVDLPWRDAEHIEPGAPVELREEILKHAAKATQIAPGKPADEREQEIRDELDGGDAA